jgi:hypothetical protein
MSKDFDYTTKVTWESRKEWDGCLTHGKSSQVDLVEDRTGKILYTAKKKISRYFRSKWIVYDDQGKVMSIITVKHFRHTTTTLSDAQGNVVFEVKDQCLQPSALRIKRKWRKRFRTIADKSKYYPNWFTFYDGDRRVGEYQANYTSGDTAAIDYYISATPDCLMFLFSVTMVDFASYQSFC